jgi:hypothetical protein
MKRLVAYAVMMVMAQTFTCAQVSMEVFLAEALHDPAVNATKQQHDFLSTKAFRLAPIQRLEFRTESNQLDPERQDYAVRVNPSNPWEVKRNNEYFEAYQQMIEVDQERALKEALLIRYQIIIDNVYYQELIRLREEDRDITDKYIAILEGQRFSRYFDADDYVELKLSKIEKVIELEDTRAKASNQQRAIEAYYPQAKNQSVSWNDSMVIEMDRIEKVIDSLITINRKGGDLAYREKQHALVTREWQLEKNNINLGFLQAQYQAYRIEQGRKPWNLSLGVTIPVFNPNKGDMAKRKLEILEAESDIVQAKNEQQMGREMAYQKTKDLISRYRELINLMNELKPETLAATLQQANDLNPVMIIRVQSKLMKLKVLTLKLKQDIYLSYVEFLNHAELLQQTPVVNFLSPRLTIISQE